MKAMLIDENKNFVWSDVAEPVVGAHDVCIEIHAAALNRADLLQRQGKYPSPKGCPPWMGLEVAGVVRETGAAVTKWRKGDRVCALLGGGGYAEAVAVDEGMVMPIPGKLTFEEAASLPEAYATCYLNLFREGGYRPGETLFFPAGASGLASVGIPMAKAFGAYVITSVLTDEIAEKIAPLQADRVIVSAREDTAQVIREEAEKGHPLDVAIDCLAGETIGQCFPYVNEGCRWVLISTLAGVTTTVPLRALLTKGIVLKGSMLRKRSVQEKSDILAELVAHIWPKLADGSIRPTIYQTLPIAQAEAAHGILERGENIGKVVLKVRD
ncbi:MAG: NAD(P)H-quinone oxidoreductase [Eubacteriales bacterium]|nr:NAD(P)H-quinone oxidoreductase [Eubacteriales bacterium]